MACIYVPCKEDPKQPDFMTLVVLLSGGQKEKKTKKKIEPPMKLLKLNPMYFHAIDIHIPYRASLNLLLIHLKLFLALDLSLPSTVKTL